MKNLSELCDFSWINKVLERHLMEMETLTDKWVVQQKFQEQLSPSWVLLSEEATTVSRGTWTWTWS